jgi:hypothetical protein
MFATEAAWATPQGVEIKMRIAQMGELLAALLFGAAAAKTEISQTS